MANKDLTNKKLIPVDDLVLDGGTQSRAAISEITVEEYAQVLASTDGKWPFPYLEVFHDGSQYLVAAGFHRTLAARRTGLIQAVPCIVYQGTAWDALLCGMSSNNVHGLRPTQADKRHAVELLLDSGKKLTQLQIAEMVGVTDRTVRNILTDRQDQNRKISGPDKFYSESDDGRKSGGSDPFNIEADPFGEGEHVGTDSYGQEAHQQESTWMPPRPPRNGKDKPGGSSERTPEEELKIQKSKTIKTAEALVRAFDDLNELRKSSVHERTITECQNLIIRAKNWK